MFDRDDWRAAARKNGRFLLTQLKNPGGRYLRSWRAPYLAYSEDYGALLEALCSMAEHDNASWLDFAGPVADDLIRLFADPADGGFFTTGHDAERLVVRQKDVFDNATPSANSLAANALLRFAALSGDRRYEEPAVRVLTMLGRVMSAHPTSFAHALAAAERSITRPLEVAIVGAAPRSPDPGARARGVAPVHPELGAARRGTGQGPEHAAARRPPAARRSPDGVRVRGLRVPAAGHEPGRAAHPARRRARRAPASDYVDV